MTELKRAEDKFILLFKNSPIGMAMVSHDTGEFLEVNQALLDYVGYSKEEFLKLTFWDITPREYDDQEQTQIEELNRTGKFGPNEKEYIRKDGTRFPIRLSGFKMKDVDSKEVVWGIIEDITLEKAFEKEHEKVKYLSITDHLTGLYNRQKLEEVLKNEIDRVSRYHTIFSVILLDVDFFKDVNDTYGHCVGDDVLIAIVDILRHSCRKADSVGRWGGEEFMIICPETDPTDGTKLAEHIRSSIEKHSLPMVGQKTVSVGITGYQKSDDIKTIITRVDRALYQAKALGRNKVSLL